LNPDAISLIQPRGDKDPENAGIAKPADVIARLGTLAKLDITAVRSGRVALIDDPLGLIPSTNLRGVAVQMRDILARWTREP
jgi:hypothetical protein